MATRGQGSDEGIVLTVDVISYVFGTGTNVQGLKPSEVHRNDKGRARLNNRHAAGMHGKCLLPAREVNARRERSICTIVLGGRRTTHPGKLKRARNQHPKGLRLPIFFAAI